MKKALAAALIAGLILPGCATLGGNTTRQVDDVVGDWIEALVAQDMDAIMAAYSENFKDFEYGDKAGFSRFISEAKSMGYLDDLKTDRSGETIEIEEDTAKVGPISLSGYFGAVTIHLQLAKEADGWKIVGQDAYGM